jgi:hypothetical protein
MSNSTENRVERIQEIMKKDMKRLTDLYDEITDIVKRVHVFGVELGITQTALKTDAVMEEYADKEMEGNADKKDA